MSQLPESAAPAPYQRPACTSSVTSAAWASTTSPLAARSDFPLRAPRTWPGQPSRVVRPGAVSSAVCVCPPPLGNVWPSAWAHRVPPCPQPVDPQTVRAPQPQPVAVIPSASCHCLHIPFWAAPPQVVSFHCSVYGQPHRATVSAAVPFLQSSSFAIPGSQAVVG